MKESRNTFVYLKDMLIACQKCESFTAEISYELFLNDEKTQYAVIHAIEIIGEASTKIPFLIKKKHTNIPWRTISGMRNKLIHEYFGVNTGVLWETIKNDIPALEKELQLVINTEQGEQGIIL